MWRAVVAGIAATLLVHCALYFRRRSVIRARDSARIPINEDGFVPGAEPFDHRVSASHAVLLIHGFADTPQTLRELATYLSTQRGWTVRALLLPGHGRTLAAFDSTSARAWLEAVDREYAVLRATYATVAIVGLSMGGALATLLAARDPDLKALVLLAPYLSPPARAERLAPLAGLIQLVIPYLAPGDKSASIFDPVARAESRGLGATPPQRIRDLVVVAHDARLAAPQVRAATLIVHSRTDYRIPNELAERHQALFSGAAVCEQRWVEGCGHVITVDYGKERIFSATADWLELYCGPPQQGAEAAGGPLPTNAR
jgi:carboxylesterase